MDDLGYDIKEDINAFMLAEARKIVDLPTYEIQRQWFGIYSQCKTTMCSSIQLTDKFTLSQVSVVKGMTGSAAILKKYQ